MQSIKITSDKENREDFKNRLQNKIEAALVPPFIPEEPEPEPVEVIEKYSKWVPARLALEPEELLPDFKKEENFIPQGEITKRDSIKHNLLNKVETANSTVGNLDEVPVEIVEKYSNWAPARLSLEPQEVLSPEFKDTQPPISPYEIEKRASIKDAILNKVESSINRPAPVEPEPATIEIIEKYSEWVPAGFALEAEEDFPSGSSKDELFVPLRDLDKRASIKQKLLNKVENSVVSEPVEPEPVEIINKFSSGIPQRSMEPVEPVFPDARRILEPEVLNLDVPKRVKFKNSLLKKVNHASIVEPVTEEPVIIEDFSQRTITPYGLDFEEVDFPPLNVSDIQETIEDFVPVTEEAPIPVLRLPYNYGDLDERALYGLLIRNPDLRHTSQTANLALDVLSGRSSVPVEFEIVSVPVPVVEVPPPMVSVPETIVRVPEPIVEVPEPIVEVPEPVVEVPEPVVEPFDFNLPVDWETIPLSTLRTDLLAMGATPEQVDAKMKELTPKADHKTVQNNQKETLTVDLPQEFSSWKPNSQYLYLTKERKFTPDQANSVIWEFNLENRG